MLFNGEISVVAVLSTFILCMIGFYLIKLLSYDGNVPLRDSSKNHNWTSIKLNAQPWYCSICEAFLINGNGYYCDSCGVCADSACIKKADVQLKCKVITNNSNEPQLHHWVQGNLPLGVVCDICGTECSMEQGLTDYKCCWCQRTVHTKCLEKTTKECDFGPYRRMIVPPSSVQVTRRKGRLLKSRILLKGIKNVDDDDWIPLIVVANKKSGSNEGAAILSEFRKYLNPAQVIDLGISKPSTALQWAAKLQPREIRVLIAGGDGTVSWVVTSSHQMDLKPEPPFAILPLGTGNDLSRVLGWGASNSTEIDIPKILKEIEECEVSQLDRWKVELTSSRNIPLPIPNKTVFMYNYFGIGIDAQVTLNFHQTRRNSYFKRLIKNRAINKLVYLGFGTKQVLAPECKNLERRLDLYLDGHQLELPELEGIVILNIPSWGAGVDLCGLLNDATEQSYNDGVLEVFGLYSSFHVAQLQIGMSSPIKLGQAKKIEINLKSKSAVQVDGEPWEQQPSKIKITYVNKCRVLINETK